MSSDDQHFLDFLASITTEVTDAVERHFDHAAIVFRETVQSTTWLPDSVKPVRARPPPSSMTFRPAVNRGLVGSLTNWISDNRAFVAAVLAFFGTGGILLYRQRKAYMRKRRARRDVNGARSEVVVVSGALNSPITRSVVLDLERRGFIVYVITATAVEEQMVKAEGKVDILPLHLNVTDPFDVQQSLEHFETFLRSPQTANIDPSAQRLSFAGLVMIPDPAYPAGPIQTISTELWADALNAKVLGTIATTQAFIRTVSEFQSRIIMLTPSIIGSLRPPFHGPEATVLGALDGFMASLRGEMSTLGLPFCNIRLGAFEVGGSQAIQANNQAETLSWPGSARAAYAQNFLAQEHQFWGGGQRGKRGSSLREMNNAVFDALTATRPRAVSRVGRGAITYELLGRLAPPGLIRWMLGLRQVEVPRELRDRASESVQWERVERL